MNTSLMQRGIFNEDLGVFIDTTNILITEKDGKHSITFRIINEEELSKIENLVLNSKEDGSYKAFITEYLLSQEELTKLANNVEIGDKKPSAITDVSTYARFSITGDGADCVSMLNYTVGYCLNANGQTIRDRGNNDGPAGTVCVSGWYEVEYQIMVIDAGCLSGGSGGGGSDSGGDNSGYNPGDGNWSGGGGSPADGNSGNPNTGDPNTGNPNTGGNNNGNDPNPNHDFSDGSGNPIITTPILTIDKREVRLYNHLNTSQQAWWNNAPQETKNELLDYFNQNSPNNVVTDEAMTFILELIDLANNEEDKEIIPNLISLSIVTKQNGYFENSFDSNYYNLINPYTEVDTEMYNPLWGVYFTVECARARYKLSQEPGWNDLHPLVQDARVFWAASSEMIHLGLDLIGLVPVVGEVADLTNGVIYVIEGDGLNATLSIASAIPFAGWYAAGIKMAKRADGLTFLVKASDDLITFGAYNSAKFRQACGIAVGDATKQAHHLIPRGSQIINHEVVQRAAQANINEGFHIDQALNGIAVATWRNQPNHTNYNNKIYEKLQFYIQQNPNATPTQCYNQLMIILNQAKQAVINNPNVHLNNLNF